VTAISEVSDAMTKFAAGCVPNITLVAPVNPLPVTVTVVPPEVGPEVGDMAVTMGGVPAEASTRGFNAIPSKSNTTTIPFRARMRARINGVFIAQPLI
jgi:hypothetical protein